MRGWSLVLVAIGCRGVSPSTAPNPVAAPSRVAASQTIVSPSGAGTSSASSVGTKSKAADVTPSAGMSNAADATRSAATCAADVPAAACAAFRAKATRGAIARCATPTDPHRIGEWRYALVAPLHSSIEDLAPDAFASLIAGKSRTAVAATSETATLFAAPKAIAYGGHGNVARATTNGVARPDVTDERATRPDVADKRWAIVPADELVPQWKVITVDGKHPIVDADGPLSIPLCANGVAGATNGAMPAGATATNAPAHAGNATLHVTNIDAADVTTVAMTGVTAMARYEAALMDRKGTTYPARDVASWFEHTDFVHVSNEVSFVPTCEPKPDTRQQPFCSREKYIELLEAVHANIVELDGSHLSDFGWKWLTHTIEMYEQRGWHFFGGGRDQFEATRPLLLEHAGTKLAFIGCNMPHSTSHTVRGQRADVAYCDLAKLDWQVRDLRAKGYAPIVSIQHEEVYRHAPPDVIVRDFRHLANAGAAVVFGSQAHWAHPFEVVDGAFVHYGAGNFFFDQAWRGAQDATNDRFYFVRGKLLTVGHLFTRLEEAGRPRPMNDRERAGFLKELDAELVKLPKADPWRAPSATPAARAIPDSFLVGSEAIQLTVSLPADPTAAAKAGAKSDAKDAKPACVIALRPKQSMPADAVGVMLRRAPAKLAGKKLTDAIADFMATKYAVDRDRITIR